MSRTKPDSEELYDWEHKTVVTVRTWQNPATELYDGDHPEDAEDCDGWDLVVEVELNFGGNIFKAGDSLGAVWVQRSYEGAEYVREECRTLRDQALENLKKDLEAIAGGSEVLAAKTRQDAAAIVLTFHRAQS